MYATCNNFQFCSINRSCTVITTMSSRDSLVVNSEYTNVVMTKDCTPCKIDLPNLIVPRVKKADFLIYELQNGFKMSSKLKNNYRSLKHRL